VEKLMSFLDMGGYAGFVWPSYGVTAVVLVGLFAVVWHGLRHDERLLAQLQAVTGERRRGRVASTDAGGRGPGDARMDHPTALPATPDNGGSV